LIFIVIVPHIVQLLVLLTDPRWISLVLLRSVRAKSLVFVTLLLPADKPIWIYFFGRFSGMKIAALEKSVPICDIFFFFFKVHCVGGTMGAAIDKNITEIESMKKYHIPQPKKIRAIRGSFAWIDHRLMRNGFIGVMTHTDVVLYLFLIVAADKNGVSFYRKEKICDMLSLDYNQFEIAKDRLIDMKLIAFEGYSALSPNGYYQVLPIESMAPDYATQITEKLTEKLFRE
jgi:hypothetical protein